jgi:hypothetical protein
MSAYISDAVLFLFAGGWIVFCCLHAYHDAHGKLNVRHRRLPTLLPLPIEQEEIDEDPIAIG